MLYAPPSKRICTVASGAPGELHISHHLPTSALLSWTPVPENLQNDSNTGYTVYVMGPVIDANATSYEVSGLRPYTKYTFGVSAMTGVGTGPAKSVSSTTPQGGK